MMRTENQRQKIDIEYRRLKTNDSLNVASLHVLVFPQYFLTELGIEFIERYYYHIIKENKPCVGAYFNDHLVGFIIGGENMALAMDNFYRNNLIFVFKMFGFALIKSSIIRSEILFRKSHIMNALFTIVNANIRSERFNKPQLLSISVHPDFWGSGVAENMLIKFEDYLHAEKVDSYSLSVKKENKRAIAFYRKSGMTYEKQNKYFHFTKEIINPDKNIEVDEIKRRYEKRKHLNSEIYTYFNRANLFIIHQREMKFLELLNKYGMNPLKYRKILDLGCGNGSWLRELLKYGAIPENLYGIDLLKENVDLGKRGSPNIQIEEGNAEHIDFPDNTFDIVMQFTVFSSIQDTKMKKNIVGELLRVLKDDGIMIWYDLRYDNPWNPDVKGIKKDEIKNLFPDCNYDFNTVTLAPPVTRKLIGISWLACYLLEKVPLLRTHYLTVIKKNH